MYVQQSILNGWKPNFKLSSADEEQGVPERGIPEDSPHSILGIGNTMELHESDWEED
jgi:hypothetical protein